jgi:hypothetical protein
MIFDVIDPKNHTLNEWIEMVEEFLQDYNPEYERLEGELYFTQDDIAEPWGEESILYTSPGEEGGKIEVRGIDQQVYMFTEGFAGRNLKDTKDNTQFHLWSPNAVYGFSHNSLAKSRFHQGPIDNIYFLYQGERAEYPQPISYERLWSSGFLRAYNWIHQQINRFLGQRIHEEVDQLQQRLELYLEFSHPSSVSMALERIPNRAAIKSRSGRVLDLAWTSPTFDQMRELFRSLPTESEQYVKLHVKLTWEAILSDNRGIQEITYLGAERRDLKPLIQLPRNRCSRQFRDRFKSHFKGYRVDRQDYLIDLSTRVTEQP